MATNLALMAAFSALPEASKIDPSKAALLSGMVAQQASLAALEPTAKALLTTILGNAKEAARHFVSPQSGGIIPCQTTRTMTSSTKSRSSRLRSATWSITTASR
ncbi:MAG: hypothetical protein ACLQU5_28160 [Isosphaeraceae bacterium]